jgi:hypothetical protein
MKASDRFDAAAEAISKRQNVSSAAQRRGLDAVRDCDSMSFW